MPASLKFVAQASMDNFYKDFKTPTDFFTLEDFMVRAAASIADYYQKGYDAKYAELRADTRSAEMVSFDADMLLNQELAVNQKDYTATLTFPFMAFTYDKSTVGLQEVLAVDPKGTNLERSNIAEIWQYQYAPFSNRILWYYASNKLTFVKIGKCNISKVNVFYVPSVFGSDGLPFPDALVPDGIVDYAITATVMKMRQQLENVVVKETLDQNNNPIMQTEMNTKQLQPTI